MSDTFVIEESDGTITVPAAVLEHAVAQAAEDVDGARVRRPRRGLEVAIADGRAHVSIALAVRHGLVLPSVARDVQQRVAETLETIFGLEASGVDIAIEALDA